MQLPLELPDAVITRFSHWLRSIDLSCNWRKPDNCLSEQCALLQQAQP